jgi:hypothetical protein
MALTQGVNSYVSRTEALAYFGDRLDVAAWTDASETLQDQALVTATLLLEDEAWAGAAVSDSQNLAHPRVGEYFDPRLGKVVALDAPIAVKRLHTAQIELAYHLLNNDGLLDSVGEVDSLSLGGISLTDIRTTSRIPSTVRRLIKPLLIRSTHAWWRAN